MENKHIEDLALVELSSFELENIEGGWNLIEYIAMGVGKLHGVVDNLLDADRNLFYSGKLNR